MLNQSKQEMLYILAIAIRKMILAFALALKNSQKLMFSRLNFQKSRIFGYYFRFLPFRCLEENPLDFMLMQTLLHNKEIFKLGNYSFLVAFLLILEE